MKRLLPLLLLLLPSSAHAWTEIEIDFRATSGYVTDPAGATYCIGDAYPVTRGGADFGWESVSSDWTRDRNTSIPRLAGLNRKDNDGTQITWRIDLPATGTYTVCAGFGDWDNDQAYQYANFIDDATSKHVLQDTNGTSFGNIDDINGNLFTYAGFFAGQTCVDITYASTIARVTIGSPSAQINATTLVYLKFTQLASDILPQLQAIGEE